MQVIRSELGELRRAILKDAEAIANPEREVAARRRSFRVPWFRNLDRALMRSNRDAASRRTFNKAPRR